MTAGDYFLLFVAAFIIAAAVATRNGRLFSGQRTPPGSKAPVIRPTRHPALTPAQVCDNLSSGLIRTLAGLCGASDEDVNRALSGLPFGSRAALEVTGCVSVDGAGDGSLTLTPLGREVIDYAHGVLPYPGNTCRGSVPPPA